MTVTEFYNEFNILYNNVMSNLAFPLDEYEISVLLTMALEELTLSLYKGSPLTGVAFEGTEESRRYLANLIEDYKPTLIEEYSGMTNDSIGYKLPDDVLVITHELGVIKDTGNICLDDKRLTIKPTKLDELEKLLENPFRQPSKRIAFRLDLALNKVEIITKYNIDYTIKYLRKPKPIILKDLSPEEVSIDGETKQATSELDSSLHKTIIKMAVQLAKISYGK